MSDEHYITDEAILGLARRFDETQRVAMNRVSHVMGVEDVESGFIQIAMFISTYRLYQALNERMQVLPMDLRERLVKLAQQEPMKVGEVDRPTAGAKA